MASDNRYAPIVSALGNDVFQSVHNAKVLVVGAGGIGCELLKNLVLSGFKDIEIIDLDTIDLSNLNRQFLFQRQHIGLSKSQVARESALRFNPHVNIIAHHGNIKSPEFGPEYFRKFNLVMNALDNIDARRHVNRICVATNIPLIESGTEGYLGQIQVIKRGDTECYECSPKKAPKTYAYCTIRSSPTKPIHCIIWAKEEFRTHFGDPSAVINPDTEEVSDSGNLLSEISNQSVIQEEEHKLEKMKDGDFAEYLFHKLFHFEIFKKVRVATVTSKDLWPGRKPPVPLTLKEALKANFVPEFKSEEEENNNNNNNNNNNKSRESMLPDQRTMTVKENAELFIQSVRALRNRFESGPLEFDKDDDDALNFVAVASNLRSYIFGIPLQSRYEVKSLAGNIIPAIATTNAVIAGLIVIEAFKILSNQFNKCRSVYLHKKPSAGRLLLASVPEKQNPNCYVCCSNFISVKINVNTTTLGYFVDHVLKGKLGMNEPSILVNDDFVYECGPGLEDDEIARVNQQVKKFLKDVRIGHNSIIEVDDNSQDFKLRISLIHSEEFPEDHLFEIIGKAEAQKQAEIKTQAAQPAAPPASKAQDDDVIIVDAPKIPPPAPKKRKRDVPVEASKGSDESKKQKTTTVEVIEL